MTTVPFALSIHSLVSSVGADAGFAALIGLAILVLLYFAQARETSSLREGLENADQWIESLESQLSQLQRGQAAAGPQPAQPPFPAQGAVAGGQLARERPGQPMPGRPIPVGAGPGGLGSGSPAPASRGGGAGFAGAPAGMAAPALTAATRMIPLPAGSSAAAPAGNNGESQQTQVAAPAAAASTGTPKGSAAEDTIYATPAPATAAAVANGRSQTAVAPPPVASRPAPSARPPAAPVAAAAAPPVSRSGSGRHLPPLRNAPPSGPSRARRLVPILIGLGAVVVIVVALLVITRNGSTTTTVHRSGKVSAGSKHGRAPAVVPASVTVAVLNGTGVTNLAHDVASRLSADGYKNGTIATAANQTHASTVVAYVPGHRPDARAVAAVLNLKTSAVRAVDQQAIGVACPGASPASPGSCAADVIVTVGNDLSGLASTQSG